MSQHSSSNKSTRLGCGIVILVISIIFWLIALSDGTVGAGAAIFLSIITIAGVLLVLLGKRRSSVMRVSKYDEEKREANIEKMLNELRGGNIGVLKVTGMKSNLITRKGEEIIFMLPNIDLIGYISIDQISGGPGISIMGYGVSGGVKSEHIEEKRVLDNGALIITNERLVFDGEKRSRETILSDILSVTQYSDGIGIKSRAREEAQFYVIKNPDQCVLSFTCEERSYEEMMNGEWLASIIEGAIRKGEEGIEKEVR